MADWKHYALIDPRVEDDLLCVRYIGRTGCRLKHRLSEHLNLSRAGGTWPVNDWIRELQSEGLKPLLVDLGRGDDYLEPLLIHRFLEAGAPLTNIVGKLAPLSSRRNQGDGERD